VTRQTCFVVRPFGTKVTGDHGKSATGDKVVADSSIPNGNVYDATLRRGVSRR